MIAALITGPGDFWHRHSMGSAMCVALLLTACARNDTPPPTPEARRAHKAAIAAAAQDRMVLQYLVKDAEVANLRVPSLRRVSRGFVTGDTSVIWFGFFAGDTLLVLDETRRGPAGVEENGRYLFRGDALHYVALDRVITTGVVTPRRTRLAFGYDSTGTLSATSKNVNDAAVPLDTTADVRRIADRARALRLRVLAETATR
jgi:hypothetical protein